MISDVVILILEIVGTVSFAVSGAFVAIQERLDLFGVLFIGTVTAVGGGILRDLLIGHIPPSIFSKLPIVLVAAASALVVFLLTSIFTQKFESLKARIEHINLFFDALGLATFTVMGTEVAFADGFSENMFLSVVLGMLTGVGGGMFRDILTDRIPYILKKHIYALASILGAILYYLLRLHLGSPVTAAAAALVFIVLLRLLAARYRWSLPKVKL